MLIEYKSHKFRTREQNYPARWFQRQRFWVVRWKWLSIMGF